jgi:hypothetical protein
MPHPHEPDSSMSAGDAGLCLIVDMPPVTDEVAYQLSELLRRLSEAFDLAYDEQILRAYQQREKEREQLFQERCRFEPQQGLPFDDEVPF